MQIKTQTNKKPLEFKNPAIAFDLQGKGAVSVTPKGLIWKAGKTQNAKNVTVKWDAFVNWMQSQMQGEPKAKKAAAKITKTAKSAAPRNGISAKAKRAPAKSAASARKVARKKAH
jgi:hypothetical protein